jgi:polyferredoxin
VDPQIEELKELVRRNITLSEETNKMVRSIRNASWWSMMFKVLWWLLILGVLAVTYSYFAPYINQILELYGTILNSDFLSNFPR